jgi:membrane fusion protein (multidrug efflux system)
MNRMTGTTVPMLVLASTLALGMLAGCDRKAPPRPAPPARVYTLRVEPSSIALRRHFVGRVSAWRSANVVARVAGVLQRRTYREGSEVRRGQPLFQIDPSYYRAQLDSDRALLAEDRAPFDNDEAAARAAAAQVQADQAQLELARLNLGYTRVVAPISGIAGQQRLTVGATVGNGTSDGGAGGTRLTTIQDIRQVYVNFTVSAAELVALRQARAQGRLRPAAHDTGEVSIELPGGVRYPQPATLDFSGVLVDASTGTVDMRAIAPNPRQLLLPGMFVTLDVELGRRDGVFLVPQPALQRDPNGAYLLLVDAAGRVVRRNGEARDMAGHDWVVTRGLEAGDRVIVSGLQQVREGQRVRALTWRGDAAAAAAPGASSASAAAH